MKNHFQFMTRAEIAQQLNISEKTLYRVLKREGISIPRSHLLPPRDYLPIFENFKLTATIEPSVSNFS